jgi:hypothetical protein
MNLQSLLLGSSLLLYVFKLISSDDGLFGLRETGSAELCMSSIDDLISVQKITCFWFWQQAIKIMSLPPFHGDMGQ